MNIDEYIKLVSKKKLSVVKTLIITTLWSSSNTFPRAWVASSRLLDLTGQKYFDRRTRELRDELGCDIETQHIDGEHHYRLKSNLLTQANPRAYLSSAEKKKLFIAAGNQCAICGKQTSAGVRGLQADHKTPLIRGGTNDLGNWQAICNDCNVSKRRACQGCNETCSSCSWAFPDVLGVGISLRLPVSTVQKIQLQTADAPKWIADLIKEKLKE
ncbi:HNH endonuclease [Octadecabacter sp. CECT 8868]|uniref:HNH endonuclease n=1 Tax=Octadecabacter algicola TaxID=2909342 RepID=UPI001F22701F|nr:HNH endonuclease [Octadecabacter algicola]MCF2904645.1 HNH endonuclease [Octadecabacter algicola]